MKKILVLMLALVMALSLAACGGESSAPEENVTPPVSEPNTEEPAGLAEVTGNGLSIMVPADIEYAQTSENGSVIFANEERTVVITVSPITESTLTSADITDDILLAAFTSEASGLSDGVLDSTSAIEHDGGASAVGFGKGTMADGTVLNSVLQYFFPESGGYYTISYLYVVDAETSLEGTINEVVSGVKVAE